MRQIKMTLQVPTKSLKNFGCGWSCLITLLVSDLSFSWIITSKESEDIH